MIPELTSIRVALRNYESQYEQVLENAENLKAQFTSLQQAYNILQTRYNDLETKYNIGKVLSEAGKHNNLLNDRQDTDTKKPQEEIPEVQN